MFARLFSKLEYVRSNHGLRTPNGSINQRNLKIWADVADKICFEVTLKVWEWDLIFGRAVKAISSPGVRSPCSNAMHLGKLFTELDFRSGARES